MIGSMRIVFLVHAAATLAMLGVILVVQHVHYPMFRGVGADGWTAYAAEHGRRITPIVLPLMTAELVTAILLVWMRPPWVPRAWALAGIALVGAAWLSTAFVQVPLHTRLGAGWDAEAHARLVATNWIRTAAWAARSGLVLWLLARLFRP